MATDGPLLSVGEVHKHFGGLHAIRGASFDVAEGSITALIGPNGAGKTSLFNVLTGFTRPDSGSVTFGGESIVGRPPHAIAALGMVRTFQLTKALAAMSVLDNVMLAAQRHPGERLRNQLFHRGPARVREREVRGRAGKLLEAFQLDRMADEYAGALSGGQRKLLELARAVMAEPRLLMLDEPMAGVNPTLAERLLEHIRHLRDEHGTTVLFIEHDMEAVMNTAEHVVVMANGEVIASDTPEQVRGDATVIEAYLGGGGARTAPAPPAPATGTVRSEPRLIVENVVCGYIPGADVLNGVSIVVRAGELVTVVGPNGAGKSTLLKAIFGLLAARHGRIVVDGQDIAALRPHDITRRGIAYVPQVANVFKTLSVDENLEVGNLGRRDTRARMEQMYALFPRLGERRRQAAGTMSGGERQMLAMARALMPSPTLLLLDEPSAGLSPLFIESTFEHVVRINDSGVTVLMVEQNARRALAMSHRGYVLDLGVERFEGPGTQLLDDPQVAELYLGGGRRAAVSAHSE